ncbi:PREDICTED: biliverdin reductase A isoform X1 [Haliaeetus leucocephalus]|nr:PREDICTED: biliverdin reductase A isoform X1 [Haliaeetus leucocephalus]
MELQAVESNLTVTGVRTAVDSGVSRVKLQNEEGSRLPHLLHFIEAEVSSSPEKKAVLGNKMTVGASGEFVCCVTPSPAKGSSQINKMFGTVVVGVGIAGLARIRDLMNPMPSSPSEHLKLFGFVSRRSFGNINEAKQISLEDALRSKEIHAAFISTENRSHEETIRMFLEAGKHVLVEYPMALSAKAAHELWEMAQQKDKVLHVEHIELLTEEYKQLKKEVAGKDLVKGTLHFTGSVLDESKTGFPAFSGIARLTWLIDLFGDLTVTSATREKHKDKSYSRMTVHFQTANKKPLTWIEERGPGMRREKKINFCFTSGCLENFPQAPRSAVGLFMQDQNLFAKKLLGQVSKEELAAEKWRILRCLDLAEVIQQHCEQPEKICS